MADGERAVARVHAGDDSDPPPPGLALGPMLRHVSDTEATIWVETGRPGVVRVLGEASPTFSVRGKHYGLVAVGGLEPGSTTPYQVHLDDELVWPAFPESFRSFVTLVEDLCRRSDENASVLVVSGDIHFSYVARAALGGPGSRVHQIVSSPIRNALIPPERGVLRFSLSRSGAFIGAMLRRSVRSAAEAVSIEVNAGPYFANNMCVIAYDGPDASVVVEQAVPDDDGGGVLHEVARVVL